MADDEFSNYSAGLNSPANNAFLITPNNSADLTAQPRCLYVGEAGDVNVRIGGVDIVFKNVSGILPIRPDRILATSTTADNIIGLY